MKKWKWRKVSKTNGGKTLKTFAFDFGLLFVRIYPKGYASKTHKFYNLTIQQRGDKWITCEDFSLSSVFKTVKKEISKNNWNTKNTLTGKNRAKNIALLAFTLTG